MYLKKITKLLMVNISLQQSRAKRVNSSERQLIKGAKIFEH